MNKTSASQDNFAEKLTKVCEMFRFYSSIILVIVGKIIVFCFWFNNK